MPEVQLSGPSDYREHRECGAATDIGSHQDSSAREAIGDNSAE
jgi:hypothetical protein